MKSDSKHIYNVTKGFCFKSMLNHSLQKHTKCNNLDKKYKNIYLEHQISIFEWFLKKIMKTGVMAAENTAINYILKYIS